MRFDISDDALLQVSSLGNATYGLAAALTPKQFHEFHYKVATPFNADQIRYTAAVCACNAATGLSLSSDTAAGLTNQKKNALKIQGATWLASAALSAYNVNNGNMKRDVGLGVASVQVGLGGLMLLRGLRKA